MAITLDYVSTAGVEGNDYKGATFVDGAYTSATKTLTKAGAFAATKVNHYLYLESNDGGSIVAGYYKVADISGAPNAVVLATDAGAGVDDDAAKCVQHDGTTTKPWRSLQGAFDLCTRNTTDGNQVNLKAGTAHVNAAALDMTTFIAGGALGNVAPLILRGYTATANDGGIGEIDCGGATMWATASQVDYVMMVGLEIHTFGDNNGIVGDSNSMLFHCEVHKGASNPAGKYLISGMSYIHNCYIHGTGSGAARAINGGAWVIGNYIVTDAGATSDYGICEASNVFDNIIVCNSASTVGIRRPVYVARNICYNSAAGTQRGILFDVSTVNSSCMNNIVAGWSGVGGIGILSSNPGVLGYNAFYNNATPNSVTDQKFIDLTASDVALAADPFTDAAAGDFSLTVAGKAALRSLGWPAAYLGAHANTDPHITIGPMQYGAAEAGGGGAVSISPAFGRFL